MEVLGKRERVLDHFTTCFSMTESSQNVRKPRFHVLESNDPLLNHDTEKSAMNNLEE